MESKLKGAGVSRRSLLLGAAMAGVVGVLDHDAARAQAPASARPAAESGAKLKVSIFSKHLQWLGVEEAAALAKEMGFDAIDLTVRAGGHVRPEEAESELPKAVAAVRKAGLDVSMITTDITFDNMPLAEKVLRAAAKSGVHHYRWGFLKYRDDKPIAVQVEELRPKMRAMAELNRRTQVCGMYHTHSGPGMVGACIWDLWLMFRDLDPEWMGINYDIGHATVEGGYGGWLATSHLVKDYMRGIALKDFLWRRNEKGSTNTDIYDKNLSAEGAFVPHWCPIDAGMVRFDGFFAIVRENGFSGPVQLHVEYPLGGVENGERSLKLPREQVVEAMRRDLQAARAHGKAGFGLEAGRGVGVGWYLWIFPTPCDL
ncbi:MAG: TIM barrel protein [Acidobacteria bacterium]|nr:TIM barrel protein [Acidobacteriota bacterium]